MGREIHEYRINLQLRRRGQAALENHRIEYQSEDYDDDEELCAAIASDLLEQLKEDREYQEGRDDDAD